MRALPVTAITLLLVGVFAGCTAKPGPLKDSGSAANSTSVKPTVLVQIVEAKPSTATGDLLVPAALSVEVAAMVLAQRDGIISELTAQEGARVSKGQVIAQLSGDDDLRAQLKQAELEVARLDLEQREYTALLKLNRSELDREATLFKQGLTPERDVERAQFKADASSLEVDKTRVAGQTAQAKVVQVKAELDRSTVRAPITGFVMHRFAKLGASVVKNDKLFEITQLAPLEVKFQVPQTEKGGLGPGSVLGLSGVESDQIIGHARIRRIDPVAEAASNTLGFLADVAGGPGLMPGMAINVHVPRRGAGTTVWIPQNAFPTGADVRKGAASTVFVAAGGKCVARAVWINSIDSEQVEIISGLAVGDKVILSPPAELKAGDLVAIKNSN
jgi:RND family efflux transporter MFP subunit